MIRKAQKNDLDAVVSLGSDFHAYSPWSHIPFNEEDTRKLCSGLIDNGVILISENGMIGGMMNPLYFNRSFGVACELFWWAESGGRALMEAFEKWGLEQGCKGFQFSALGDDKAERMAQLFDRAGYRKIETGYFKEV